MTMPCPLRNFVAEWKRRSAPRSNGRIRYGVVNVASTRSGSFAACAISATAGTSSTSSPGLPRVSPNSEARVRADRGAPGVEVARVDERRLDAEAGQGVGEEVVRAAVERVARDDVRARAEQRAEREVHRRLAARHRDRADPALERGDALLQHGVGRVRDARVDVPAALHVEERRGVVGVLEDVGGGLVDRRRARAELRIGGLSGVQAERVEAQVLRCRHGAVSERARSPDSTAAPLRGRATRC